MLMLMMFLLGFSAGLPLALTSSTLQAWFAVSGVPILTIGFLSLVGQPYIYKFLWAPLIDRYQLPFLGKRRGWMLITQVLLLFSIIGFAYLNPTKHSVAIGLLALWVAFLSASQDIAVDAYRTEILKREERGLGAAWFTNGYRIAMIVSGGLALILADHWGWPFTYLLMGLLMLIGILATCFSKEDEVPNSSPVTLKQAFVNPLQEFFSRNGAIAILLLVVSYRLGDGFTLNLTPTFLIQGLEFSLTAIGTFYKTAGILATIAGLLIGGYLMRQLTLLQALLRFGIAQAVSTLSFAILAAVGKNTLMLGTAIILEYGCSGMAIAAFTALLMNLCDLRYTAAHFALLSALAATGRVFIGPFAAVIAKHTGWVNFYVCSFLIYLLPVLLLLTYRSFFSQSLEQGIFHAN